MAILSSKPPPLCSRHSLSSWAVNRYYLTKICLTVENYSSVVSSLLVANYIIVTQSPSTPCASLAMNDHVTLPHLYYCKITISPLPLYCSATSFILSITAALCPYFLIPPLLLPRFYFCCVMFFFFVY